MTVLVIGADERLVVQALEQAGEDDQVIALEPSAAALERLVENVRDPRLWFLIGDPEVVPLPDRSVDRVLGAEPSPELDRVSR